MNFLSEPADSPGQVTGQSPVHEQVYRRLREQIMYGEMTPGQAVTIQGLAQALGVGLTPVREAIRRLTSDGALVFQGNRRVSVPKLSEPDAEQLVFLRKTIESELVRRAAMRISDAVIDQLDHIDKSLDQAISTGDVARYLANNYRFHSLLYDQADAPVLANMASRVWLRFGPSLRVVCGLVGTQSLCDHHKALLGALRLRDSGAAAAALIMDVEQGFQLIAAILTTRGSQGDSVDTE